MIVPAGHLFVADDGIIKNEIKLINVGGNHNAL